MNESMTLQQEKSQELGNYVQLFVYKLPKENHDEMVRLANQFTNILRKHGTLGSDFYQLENTDIFKGLTSILKTVSASDDEEIWVEVDHYRDREHREAVLVSIRKDPEAGPMDLVRDPKRVGNPRVWFRRNVSLSRYRMKGMKLNLDDAVP